jgi:hypothetical protein
MLLSHVPKTFSFVGREVSRIENRPITVTVRNLLESDRMALIVFGGIPVKTGGIKFQLFDSDGIVGVGETDCKGSAMLDGIDKGREYKIEFNI